MIAPAALGAIRVLELEERRGLADAGMVPTFWWVRRKGLRADPVAVTEAGA
jgi:hypothetical protein